MNNESYNKSLVNWYPGHMAKTKREIIENIKLIDVVIEIIDARIPISSQNPDIKELIGNKKRILVLNKSDLSDEKENEKWIQYFKNKGIIAVLVNSNSGNGIKEVQKQVEKIMQNDLEKMAKKGRIGKPIRAIVLGIPNVGKSSFINRMANKNSAQVGNKPGITKQKQWIHVNNKIELLDTPGILWPKFQNKQVSMNLCFTGTIKDDIIDKEQLVYYLLEYLYNNHLEKLMLRYKLTQEDIEQIENIDGNKIMYLLEIIARKRGAILSGNVVDTKKISDIVLEEFKNGKIGKITIETVKC